MKREHALARLVADNDQDRAACDEWMRTASESSMIAVWTEIQKSHKNPVIEIVTRFAQLAFAEAYQRMKEPPHAAS